MAWTSSDADTLRAAIASGAKLVQYADGRRVEYQTIKEMIAAIATIEAAIAAATPTSPSRMSRVVHHRV